MGIVEGGQDRAVGSVDDAGRRADQRADIGVGADRDDPLALDSESGGAWPSWRPNNSIQDDQRCSHGSILRGCENVPSVMKLETNSGVPAKSPDLEGSAVARAHTLPSRMYLDPVVLDQEKERIFSRTWQLVAHSSELARHGDFKPTTILDEPILLTHPEDGRLRGFYNVCRHRAAQVVTTRGNRKSLQCGYHGWVYGLDGRLQVAREMDGTEDFDKADFGLVPVQVDRLGPFIFANLDDHAATSTTTSRAITCPSRTRGFSKSSTTTSTGSRPSATTRSSTRRSES